MTHLGMPADDLRSHQNLLNEDKRLSIDKMVRNINRRKEEETTEALATKFSLPYLNLMNYQPEPGVVNIIPRELAVSGNVFAFKKSGRDVYLAVSALEQPGTLSALDTLKGQTDYNFVPVLVSRSSMAYLLAIYDTFAPK